MKNIQCKKPSLNIVQTSLRKYVAALLIFFMNNTASKEESLNIYAYYYHC